MSCGRQQVIAVFLNLRACGIIPGMSGKLSILLIENQVQVAVTVGRLIAQHLPSYTLYVSTSLAEVLAEPQPADVILLGLALLDPHIPQCLSPLLAAYPEARIFLLCEPTDESEEKLLHALAAGAADYAAVSEAGLLTLARRLAELPARQPPDGHSSAVPEPVTAFDVLSESTTRLAAGWNTHDVLHQLLRQMIKVLGAGGGYIASWHKNQGRAVVQAWLDQNNSNPAHLAESSVVLQITNRPAFRLAVYQQQLQVHQINSPALAEAERQEMQQQGILSRLIVPLVAQGETVGWAELQDKQREQNYSSSQVSLVKLLAGQAAVALQHLLHVKQTQQALDETEALYQVASALATSQDAQAIISTVVQEYLRALSLKQGSAILFDFEAKRGIVKVSIRDDLSDGSASTNPAFHGDLEGRMIPLKNDPIYERLMRTYLPVVIEDIHAGGEYAVANRLNLQSGSLVWAGPEALSLLVIPIQTRGDVIGALVVEATRQKRVFEQWEISLGRVMADQLGIALQNVKLYEAEYQRRQQAETLREVAFTVGSSLKLNEVLERILDQLGRVLSYDSAAIHLIEGKYRRIIAGRGFPHPEKVIGSTFPVQLDPTEPGSIAIHTRQPVVIDNVQQLYQRFRELPHQHIKSWMGIPLIARDKIIGLISIDQVESNAFQQEDIELAQAFASQVAIALENARLYELEIRELERELEIAQEIQENLLPQFVPQLPGLQISGRLLPAQHIGGDFFHFFPVGEDKLGVVIGDVSGKGIPAALYMAVAITAIDIHVRSHPVPAELLNRLNETLYNRLKGNKMNIGLQVATFAPLTANESSDRSQPQGAIVTIGSAGMIAPMGATVHGCRFLPVSGLPLAALPYPEHVYGEEEFLLDPFTTVIFTSDGIVEARNESGEMFGFERLEATVNEIIGRRDAEVIAEHIIHTAQAFLGQAEQNDDMTVVVVVKT